MLNVAAFNKENSAAAGSGEDVALTRSIPGFPIAGKVFVRSVA